MQTNTYKIRNRIACTSGPTSPGLELNDNADYATLSEYYPSDIHTNTPHDHKTTLPNIMQSSIHLNIIHPNHNKKTQKITEATSKYFHESIDLPATIPSIHNHMEEDSPHSPHTSNQAPHAPLTSQPTRKPAPIAHRQENEPRNDDARTAPHADHQTQDPQQTRTHYGPHISSATATNDAVKPATPRPYSIANQTNTYENPAATYNTTTAPQPKYHSTDTPLDTPTRRL